MLWYFIAGWLLLNLLQSFFTELFHDEALYWAFSDRLATGYFDHPPLTAWVIALTSWLPGEVGVRLPFILMTGFTIYLLYDLVRPKDEWLFFTILAGLPILHVGGFFAAPDVPLIFLMTLFLWLYKSYYYSDSWRRAILLGVVLGLMGLAKYHAILFVVALLLSNVALFRRRSFYMMGGVAVLVILPHLIWQYHNDWITFQFHLFHRRGGAPWSWLFVGDYLAGQLAIYGLFLAPLLFLGAVRYKPNDHYDCAFKYTFFVVMIFFTLSVFRGRVEANWTVMALPPMIYLAYQFLVERKSWRRWVFIVAGVSLVLILAVRLILAVEIIPQESFNRNETHGFKAWAQQVSDKANGRPVVFLNSYQRAAKYLFYGEHPEVISFSTARYSGSQWDVWRQDEWALQGRPVLAISNELPSSQTLEVKGGFGGAKYLEIDVWRSYNYLTIKHELTKVAKAGALEAAQIITLSHDMPAPVTKSDVATPLRLMFYQYGTLKHTSILMPDLDVSGLEPGEERPLEVSFNYPDAPGQYDVRFSIGCMGIDGANSLPHKMELK